ncbi:TonB-dependent receptor [Massilia yuzhufengensis]|uniref:Iron complex outermembrane recepter protein n=1 Tax=Massilia yuzhufengensis TaxID=1164594 RepID=A0A1I1J544_9BURK|nr:TonB-dependent siderophore receptor [Massilia yuzhufengensis]SFC43505.1 iron complex outermembrane recepter protein [Massilia yuzhufengensis]
MKLLRLTPTALAAALLVTHAQAQETPPVEPIATVVVSASADASAQGLPSAYAGGQVARGGRLGLLGNIDIMDTPFNTMNYTQALIQDQQARSVADVVQNDPAVRVARGFGNYQELYVIRGFAVNSDDLAYNGLYGMLPRQFVASELLERVEVLRGANSFVNGAAPGGGGIGGAINLLPKRAPNAPLTQVTMGVETGGQAYVATDIARRFGPESRLGVRVNAVRRDGDTAVEREGRELSLYSVGVDYRGRGYRLSADVGHQDHQLTGARPSVTVAAGVPIIAAPDSDSNYAQPWTFSGERDTFGTLRGEVDLPGGAVAWAALGLRSGDEMNILSSATVTAANGNATMSRFDNTREDKVRTGEIGARTELKTGSVSHKLSATASSFHSESKNAYGMSDFAGFASNIYRPVNVAAPSAGFFTGGVLANPLLTQKSILSSVALADTLGFMDERLLLTVGARHQTIKSFGYDYTTGAPNAQYEESDVTPVAGIVFKPLKGVSVYANYSEALQQGPVASGTDIVNVGEVFAPYVSRQKEIGVKYDGGKLGMTAAVFSTAQPSGYVQDRRFGLFGEQRNRGLELTVFGTPVRGLRLLGGLTLLDAELRKTAGGLNEGKDAIGVPDTQVNLGAEWDVPGVQGLSLNARGLYTSTQYADAGNTQKLPSWSRLDIGANYATRFMDRNVTLRARVDNVTDKNYWASAGGYPGFGYLVQGGPRSVVVSATVDF